jgi:hypothetical protein
MTISLLYVNFIGDCRNKERRPAQYPGAVALVKNIKKHPNKHETCQVFGDLTGLVLP